MSKVNHLISTILGSVLCLSHVGLAYGSDTNMADSVFINANVYTANPAQPFAQAIAIKGQKTCMSVVMKILNPRLAHKQLL